MSKTKAKKQMKAIHLTFTTNYSLFHFCFFNITLFISFMRYGSFSVVLYRAVVDTTHLVVEHFTINRFSYIPQNPLKFQEKFNDSGEDLR